MLDRPHRVEAKLVGQGDLLEAIVVDPFFGFAAPWPRHRDFVENAEFHDVTSSIPFV